MTFDGVTVKYAGGRFLMNHRVVSTLTYDRMEKVCTFTIYGKMTLLVTAVGFD